MRFKINGILTWILLLTVGESLHKPVTETGLGGRFGSTPGLFVGIGVGNGHILSFTFTAIFGGKLSSCSHVVSSRQNLI